MSAFSSHQPRRDTLHEVKKEKSSLLIDTDRLDRQLVIDRRHTRDMYTQDFRLASCLFRGVRMESLVFWAGSMWCGDGFIDEHKHIKAHPSDAAAASSSQNSSI